MTIQEQRRRAFEEYVTDYGEWPQAAKRNGEGNYILMQTFQAWQVWNAALDSVEVELPDQYTYSNPDTAGAAIFDCATCIKAAGVRSPAMTDIDWSKAPEGATHWEPENHLVNAGWMKVDGNGDWFFWSSCRKTWTEHMIAPGAARMSRMIARATAEEERNAAIVEIGRLFHEGGPAAIYFAGYRKQEAV